MKFWLNICNAYRVILPATIIEDEAFFFTSDTQKSQAIKLSKQVAERKITRLEASLEDYLRLKKRVNDNFLNGIDAGEKEALALLLSNPKIEILFSSGDGLALKALGILGIGHQAISLEEIIKRIGVKEIRKMPVHFTKKWLQNKVSEGVSEQHLWLKQ
jgi:hypothetical protein